MSANSPQALMPTQMGTHLADEATANGVVTQMGGSGLYIGPGEDGLPFTLKLFGPDATAVLVIGGVALAQLISFRAIAMGASVDVQTTRPDAWEQLINVSAGSSGSIRRLPPDASPSGGSPSRPRLHVVDTESASAAELVRGAAWTTTLTVYDRLTNWNANLLANADLVLLRSLSAVESRLAAKLLNLPNEASRFVTLPPDGLAVVSRSLAVTCHLATSATESWIVGTAARR